MANTLHDIARVISISLASLLEQSLSRNHLYLALSFAFSSWYLSLYSQRFQVLLLVVMRCYLHQPLWLQRHAASHVLFTRQDQFVVDDPFGLILDEHARWMDVNNLAIFDSAIALSVTLKPC